MIGLTAWVREPPHIYEAAPEGRIYLHREANGIRIEASISAALGKACRFLPAGLGVMLYGVTDDMVELTLCSEDGIEIWMGTPVRATCPKAQTEAQGLDDVATRCRARLIGAMQAAGFENDPAAWWRFWVGDQKATGPASA